MSKSDEKDSIAGELRPDMLHPAQEMTPDVDPAETNNLAKQERLRVTDLGKSLETIIQRGRSRPGRPQSNDTRVRFDVIQSQRWTASSSDSED